MFIASHVTSIDNLLMCVRVSPKKLNLFPDKLVKQAEVMFVREDMRALLPTIGGWCYFQANFFVQTEEARWRFIVFMGRLLRSVDF